MKTSALMLAMGWSLAAVAKAEVRVWAQDANGLALIKYECTAGEVIRAFALDVAVDRGQIIGISEFFVGPSSTTARGYGIFPAAFRDHITVSSGTSANWTVAGYDPLAVVADAPSDTLPGLGSNGVTLELGALWDAALPAAAPAASGTLCALQLSQGANVRVAANASRGGVVASPDGTLITPVFAGAAVGTLPEIAVEQPLGTDLSDGSASADFGSINLGSTSSALTFTVKNLGTAELSGLAVTTNGAHAADFVVGTLDATTLAAGASTSFTVTFAPGDAGPRTAALQIASNDLDENPFDLNLTGTGVLVTTPLQAWRLTYFGSSDNSGDGADLNDFDKDGLVNLVEFAFGLNPTLSDAGLLPQPQITGSSLSISFNQPAGVGGITYDAEWSQTLEPGAWTAIPDTGTPPEHTFSVPIGTNTQLYMRLKVTSPP